MSIPYFYDAQIKRVLVQFGAVFQGLQVKVDAFNDKPARLIDVPIKFANQDRVVAWINSKQTQNSLIRLPLMSFNYIDIIMAPEMRKGVNTTRRDSYMPRGGVFPDDIETYHQIMPVPYKLQVELNIYASNISQQLQILEQILIYFDPNLQIQTSDATSDWGKISTIELEQISSNNNFPIGADKRILQNTLLFTIPMYLAPPTNIKKDFVKSISLRISAINTAITSNAEILADFDIRGEEYDTIVDLDDLNLPP